MVDTAEKIKVPVTEIEPTGSSNIKDVLDVIDDVQRSVQRFETRANDLVSKSTAVGKKKAETELEIGRQKALITLQEDTAKLRADDLVRDLFHAAGGANMLIRLSTEQKKATETLLKEQAELDENIRHNSTGLIDFISNMFAQSFNAMDVQQAEGNLSNINRTIQSVAVATEANAKILNQIAHTRTAATVAANQKIIALESGKLADAAELEAVRTNALALETVTRAKGLHFENVWRSYQAGQSEENQQQRRAEYLLNIQRLEHQLNQAMKEDKAAELRMEKLQLEIDFARDTNPTRVAALQLQFKEAKEAAERAAEGRKQLVAGVQRGEAILGLPASTEERILSQYEIGGEAQKKVTQLFVLGAEGTDSAGASPADVLLNFSVYNPELLAQTDNPILKTIINARDDIELRATTSQTKLTRDQAQQQLDTVTKQLLKVAEGDIHPGDTNNPYVAPPMTSLSQTDLVKNDPFYKKILEPMQLVDTNPQQLVDLAVQAIRDDKVTVEEATQGIQNIFRAAGAQNTERHMFQRFSIPPQVTYNTRVHRAGPFGGKRIITDLADSIAIKGIVINNLTSYMPLEELTVSP